MSHSVSKDQRPARCIRRDLSLVLLALLHNLMLSFKLIRRSQLQILPFIHLARTIPLARYWHYLVLV